MDLVNQSFDQGLCLHMFIVHSSISSEECLTFHSQMVFSKCLTKNPFSPK